MTKKFDTLKLVEISILLALVVILQSLASFGYLPLCLCLVPITLGALVMGKKSGSALGFAFGIVAFFWGLVGKDVFTSTLLSIHPFLTAVVCLAKGTLAGFLPAVIYDALKKKNERLAIILSSISAPIANTGVFILGCVAMMNTINSIAQANGQTFVYFVFITCAGVNFLIELAINVVFAPIFQRLIPIIEKNFNKSNTKQLKKYKTVFFDLDGTIADSGEGVSNSVEYALEKFGIEDKKESFLRFVGPPLAHSFKTFYGFDDKKATRAIELYREYYKEKGIYECHIYEGIRELLISLRQKGYKIVLATSKPEEFAHRVLDFLNVSEYFDHICGATMDEKTRATKDDILKYACETSGAELSSTIMIGDRHFDINGARKLGIDSIGVTFGYGSLDELTEAGATYIVTRAEEIDKIL